MAKKKEKDWIKELVWSPVKHTNKVDIKDSEIWTGHRYKPEEMTDEIRAMFPVWYQYTIFFEHTTPVSVANMKIVRT